MKVHFIGIGGVGMSALARIMLERGYEVSGSDLKESYVTKGLVSAGAKISYRHEKENVDKDATVVYSTDIKEDNPEWVAAKENKVFHRSECLRTLLDEKKAILVAGAHGKTTTTSLLSYICVVAGLNPSFVIGGFSDSLGGVNGKWGRGDYFIAEADESDGSFLRASPEGAIVTNVDFDHLNYWGSENALLEAYQKFIAGITNRDLLFYWNEDPFMSKWNVDGISFGFEVGADLRALNLRIENGRQLFDIEFEGEKYLDIELALLGEHNVLNAIASFGMALSIGADVQKIREALITFGGVKRRLQRKGSLNGASIYDDYAHHPTEIEATLAALKRAFQTSRTIAVFQPHRYSRLRDLMDEFVKSTVWKDADELIITDVFSAGEPRIEGVNTEVLLKKIEKRATYVPRGELTEFLRSTLVEGDIVVTMGAGDITAVSGELVI